MEYTELRKKGVYLGRAGEDGKKTVWLDVTAWNTAYDAGAGVLLFTSPAGRVWPMGAKTVTDDVTGTVTMEAPVTAAETALAGVGHIEAQWISGGEKVKSQTFNAMVLESGYTGENVPDNAPGWVADLITELNAAGTLLEELGEVASEAHAASRNLETYAAESIAAAEAAENAKAAAEEAAGAAEGFEAAAAGHVDTVNRYKNAAAASATAAATAAESAMSATPEGYADFVGSAAPAYSSSSAYSVGDLVMYESVLYRCISAIGADGEDFDEDHWAETTAADELGKAAAMRSGYLVCGTKPFVDDEDSGKYRLADGFSVVNGHTYIVMIYAHDNLELSGDIKIGLVGQTYTKLKPGFENKRIMYQVTASSNVADGFVYLNSDGVTGNGGLITVYVYDITMMEALEYNYKGDYEQEGAASIVQEGNTGRYNIMRFKMVAGHHYVAKIWGDDDLSFEGTVNINFGDSMLYPFNNVTSADLKAGLTSISKTVANSMWSRIYFVGTNVSSASGMIRARVIDIEKLMNARKTLDVGGDTVIDGTSLDWQIGTTSSGSYITTDSATKMTSGHILLGKGSVIMSSVAGGIWALTYDLDNNYTGGSNAWRTMYVMQSDGYVRLETRVDSGYSEITPENAEIIKGGLKIIVKPPVSQIRKIMANDAAVNRQFGTLLAEGRADLLEGALWEVGFLSTAEGIVPTTLNSKGIITSEFLDVAALQGKDFSFVYDEWPGHKPTGRVYLYDSEKAMTRYVGMAGAGTTAVTVGEGERYARVLLTDDWNDTTFSNASISDYTGITHLYVQVTQHSAGDEFDSIYKSAIMSARQKFAAKAEAGRLGYGFLTDLHLKSNKSESNLAQRRQYRALIEAAKMSGMDFVVLGGDMIDAESTPANVYALVEEMMTYADVNDVKVLILAGNHDDNCYGTYQSKSWLRGLLIDRVTAPAVFPDDKACYYYVDVPGKNWRAVCLDCIDYDEYNSENSASKKGSNWWSLSRSQVKWFCETALNTGRNIAVFTHMSPDKTRNSYNLGDEGGFHTDLVSAITAYNARSSVTLYGTTYNFSGATGTVKLMHTGHSHIEYMEDYTVAGIPCLNTGCGKQFSQEISENETPYEGGDEYTYELNETAAEAWHMNGDGYVYRHYVPREIGTLSEALIDIVSVNTDNIYAFRLGVGDDRTYSWDAD